MAKVLTSALGVPIFTDGPAGPTAPLSVAERLQHLAANRLVLERLFPDVVAGDPRKQSWFTAVKLGYALSYALVMWLLLFGTMGAFQALCHGHSRTWRYLADSSYWIYLAHLPLVAVLQVWVAPMAGPALIKFPLMVGAACVILFGSYHYLVRSTFIGRLLNGQSHPFTAWPFAKPEGEPAVMPAIARAEVPSTTR